MIGGATVLGLLYLVGNWGDDDRPTPRATSARSQPQVQRQAPKPLKQAHAADMVREVERNEVAFEQSWQGKRAMITGKVQRIDADISDATVHLGGSRWDTVMATDIPKGQVVHLRKGQTITVVCDSVMEVLGDAVASDCQRNDYR